MPCRVCQVIYYLFYALPRIALDVRNALVSTDAEDVRCISPQQELVNIVWRGDLSDWSNVSLVLMDAVMRHFARLYFQIYTYNVRYTVTSLFTSIEVQRLRLWKMLVQDY